MKILDQILDQICDHSECAESVPSYTECNHMIAKLQSFAVQKGHSIILSLVSVKTIIQGI